MPQVQREGSLYMAQDSNDATAGLGINIATIGARKYAIGKANTPIVKFIHDFGVAYVLKPEGLFHIDLDRHLVTMLFMIQEHDIQKMLKFS